ncbi:MAG: pantoate--beta-alanine ligase [Bacteroidales bacterium]|nr:pantoate--beta-alanine ligase [Bacteroidales bacterium]
MINLTHTITETQIAIQKQISEGKTIGFVPTMGALHEGHITLIRRAAQENDFVVVSIFVNPIQFNNKEDLAKYPRNLDADIQQLEGSGCNLVFAPTADEMYPEPDLTEFDFGQLDKVMEGKFRPGHFNGVAIVVKRLFEIVTPTKAYFGEKDFQQLAIIKKMVSMLQIPVEIVPCPIVRETDGLAMSSRNARLTPEERAEAPVIFKALSSVKENYSWFIPDGVKQLVTGEIQENNYFRVEYVSIVNAETLLPFEGWQDVEHAVVCVAAFIGPVRLIDNIVLY